MSFKLVGIGELLWDLLPEGPQMGGAPANFAYHASALGAQATVISRVGNDDLGRELMDRLQKLRIPTDCVELDPSLPTSTVDIAVNSRGEPEYIIHEPVAWDHLTGESPSRLAVQRADAVCFGTLAQRCTPSRSTIRALLASAKPSALRIFDINLRQRYYSKSLIEESLRLANVLKINESELSILSDMFGITGDHRTQISQFAARHNLCAVAYTRGPRGSLLLLHGRWSNHNGVQTHVRDTVGAGDSFTAAMALGILAAWDVDQINQRANEIAAYVASCKGATPTLPDKLRFPFECIG